MPNNIGQLTYAEYLAIMEHLQFLENSIEDIVTKYLSCGIDSKGKYVKGQVKYWENVRSGFKWAKTVAQQRMEKPSNERSEAVHKSRPDYREGRDTETRKLFE